ncbi:MAG: CDP-diacylglycerol--glycerol-3-phosphate 3-phosphatidyltransferase [Chthoniobacterales bacterium]
MNLPNKLTCARIVLTGFFVAFMSMDFRWSLSCALVIFFIATMTDYLDGEIARKRNLITDFGKLMDPLADKVLMAAAFICLIPYGAIFAWVAIILISREFLITGLRLLAAAKGQVLPAEKMGKHKTTWQMITVFFFLSVLALEQMLGKNEHTQWLNFLWVWVGPVLVLITTVLTIYSGFGYLWKNRALLTEK